MKKQHYRRSDCPISFALETFGDMWSLLIVRDIIYFGKKPYGEFLESDEGIATNILASRLAQLVQTGILEKKPHATDKRKEVYALTEKGLDFVIGRYTLQSQWLGPAAQSRHRPTHPELRLSLAYPSDSGEKSGFTRVRRTAEAPDQTVNVDLCFVPATRITTEAKLPSVSGSSGRLVLERMRDQTAEPSYPGRAFDDPQRSYTEAMLDFVAA